MTMTMTMMMMMRRRRMKGAYKCSRYSCSTHVGFKSKQIEIKSFSLFCATQWQISNIWAEVTQWCPYKSSGCKRIEKPNSDLRTCRNENSGFALIIPHIFVWGSCVWFCIPPPPPPLRLFVTQHLSHILFHTPLCHTPSFTHHFVTHHLSHTSLSTTIFHTQLCHTTSFTYHTTLSHNIFHTPLCHPPSFRHNFVTHHPLPSSSLPFLPFFPFPFPFFWKYPYSPRWYKSS